MPLYDFECQFCLTIFEDYVKIHVSSDNKEDTSNYPQCPKCAGESKRLPPKSNFILKGSGWAKDGYSKEKNESN